jgi:hypothetical protein
LTHILRFIKGVSMKTQALIERRGLMAALAAALLSSLLGCSGPPAKTVAVSGKVVDASGAPVKGASISLTPTGKGFAATGNTGDDGSFTLSTFEENDGAPIGEYVIAASDAEGNPLKAVGDGKVNIQEAKSDLEIKVEK